jgi:methylthioxylose transferase
VPPTVSSARAAIASATVGLVLVAAAIAVPRWTDEDVRVHWPPLHADWDPRFGVLTLPAIAIGLLLWVALPRLAAAASWRTLLTYAFVGTWLWTMALALTEGTDGLARVFERPGEYVYDAQRVDSIGTMLRTFVDHIPMDSPDHWHTHVAGHPPGALLFFVLLDRLGITDPFWIGVVVVTIGSTAVVAVLVTLKALGSAHMARQAMPWLVLAPTAVWMGVNGDALFTAVAAWGLALLAIAAAHRRPEAALAAGLLLGACVYLSYGLVLLGILAVAVMLVGRTWRPLPWALAGAAAVAAAFTVAGFEWWKAYPVLHDRYYAGIASERPYSYWVWADVAAWTFTVGLVVWAAFPRAIRAFRDGDVLARLAGAALLTILVATVSGMSKAEVERIWLPFTIWVVALPALLPERWRRPALLSQVVLALCVQQLVLTRW